ncbi:MAG: RNA-binding protein [Xenococcaceae cyanobacterium MO_188.B32]|nr:RNA-binding protein [Xenococcaceae cyanobacterium MO_188.B32]
MSVRLYVGNLPKEPVDREALEAMFADSGKEISTKVIKDRKTGKCRGFAFVTVPSDEIADEFIEKFNGQSFMDSALKIEKALPRSKGNKNKEEQNSSEGGATNSTPKRNKTNKRSKKQTHSTNQQDAVQPDPRWADELAKLKEMLAAANN